MSGPILQGDMLGSIDTFAINERVSIDEFYGVFRIDFSLVNDEFIGAAFILGKIKGVDVLCPGVNANSIRAPIRAGALPPDCRNVEKLT